MSTATRTTTVPTYRGPYASIINPAARANGLDPFILAALLWVESRWNPHAHNPSGAEGIAEIMLPAHPDVSKAQADNPAFAIPWAARYLAELKRHAGGSITRALALYNTGPNAPAATINGPGMAYSDQVRQTATTLRQRFGAAIAALAGGFLRPGSTYKPGRADHGRDFQTDPGAPIIAPGNGVVVDVKSDPSGFGPSYPVVRFTSGPYSGQTMYLGHTLAALRKGARFVAGAVLSYTGTSGVGSATLPGWAEIGFGVPGTSSYGVGGPPFGGAQGQDISLWGTLTKKGPFGSGSLWDYGPFKVPRDVYRGVEKTAGAVDATANFFALLTDKEKMAHVALWLLFMFVGFALLYQGTIRLFGTRDVVSERTPIIGPELARAGA